MSKIGGCWICPDRGKIIWQLNESFGNNILDHNITFLQWTRRRKTVKTLQERTKKECSKVDSLFRLFSNRLSLGTNPQSFETYLNLSEHNHQIEKHKTETLFVYCMFDFLFIDFIEMFSSLRLFLFFQLLPMLWIDEFPTFIETRLGNSLLWKNWNLLDLVLNSSSQFVYFFCTKTSV